jgi:hypothetical protein
MQYSAIRLISQSKFMVRIGQIVRHVNPDCYLGNTEGEVIWVDPSQTICDVLFNLPSITEVAHPCGRFSNRFNDPRRLPVRLLELVN